METRTMISFDRYGRVEVTEESVKALLRGMKNTSVAWPMSMVYDCGCSHLNRQCSNTK